MKKHIVTIAIIVVFLAGLSVLLYPYVADYFNSIRQSRAVASYKRAVEQLSVTDSAALFEAAHAYNDRLRINQNRFKPTEEDTEEYNKQLNFAPGGIMGTLEIELINVMLPIYHGTSESVLQVGAGHLEGSSLPVGGIGTHAAVTAHRGLPSSTLLTNLDRMMIGDTFAIHILGEILWYQVDQIVDVDPDDFTELAIVPDIDYCTVFTCTPYGINSHRMMVRGFRVEGPEGEPVETHPEAAIDVRSEAGRVDITPILLIAATPVLVILLVIQIVRFHKKHGRWKNKQ